MVLIAADAVEADRLGLDIGSINILERYQTWRRFDTFRMGVTTDVLNRLFSNDVTPIRIARDVGLGIVDRLPGLKSFFIGQAKVIPEPIRIPGLLALPVLAVLLTMFYWLWRIRMRRNMRGIVGFSATAS